MSTKQFIPLVSGDRAVNCIHFKDGACSHASAQAQPACRQRCVLTWSDVRIVTCAMAVQHPAYQQRLV